MPPSQYHPFPHTHWSLVQRAGLADGAARREALGILLSRYTPALESYLVHIKRLNAHDASDLLQAFIADRLLSSELLANADASRGRFRSLLLTSLNHFAISRWRSAQRRTAQPLEGMEDRASHELPPAVEVEVAWARELLKAVVERLRQECASNGRHDVWIVFEGRLLAEVEAREPASYESLASALGLRTPTQAANLLVTAKRMFTRLLRAAVAEYEPDEEGIEAEIADLHRVLAAASNRRGAAGRS